MTVRSNKIFTAQQLNRRASIVFAAQDADAANDELLAEKYASQLASLAQAASQGLFQLSINVSDYEDAGAELTDLLERYGFTVTIQPPTDIGIFWLPEPKINDTPTAIPVITTVTPAQGPTTGTTVTIVGTGFTGVTAVVFTGVNTVTLESTEYTIVSGNRMTINVPPASQLGTSPLPYEVSFTVVNTVGSSIAKLFTYTSN